MYRVINEVRAKELIRQPVDYIYNADFDDPAKEADDRSAPMPGQAEFEAKRAGNARRPRTCRPQMAHLYEWPLLTKEQEQHLFRKMNFLKHQLHKLPGDARPGHGRRSPTCSRSRNCTRPDQDVRDC